MSGTDPVILVAEGSCGGNAWRQYFVVTVVTDMMRCVGK